MEKTKLLQQIRRTLFKLAQLGEISPRIKCAYLKKQFPSFVFPFDWMFEQTTVTLTNEKTREITQKMSHIEVNQAIAQLKSLQVGYISILDKVYPEALKTIYAPPLTLFYKGNIELLTPSSSILAVVGPRKCSKYGQTACEFILKHFAKFCPRPLIISGLAAGIDAAAHQTALKYQVPTIAVIGTGLDRYYPKANKNLQIQLMAEQLVLSEYPLGSNPLKYHFPDRNRIVAGLSRGVLIVEARKRSGTLITASRALEEGRDVFAIPGSIFSKTSQGTNALIQQGAICVKDGKTIPNEWL